MSEDARVYEAEIENGSRGLARGREQERGRKWTKRERVPNNSFQERQTPTNPYHNQGRKKDRSHNIHMDQSHST